MKQLEVDLAVVGGTAPGIVAAVRAAREGLRVALLAPTYHLGGSLSSLGALETHYRGVRAPLLQEFDERVKTYYRTRYSEDSDAIRVCADGRMTTFEPHVAENILEAMVAAEPGIEVHRERMLDHAECTGRRLTAVEFHGAGGEAPLRVVANAFVEATYEGDLLALAGVECRIGRESREEFGEPRAGRVFTRWLRGQHPRAAVEGRLNLVNAGATTSEPLPESTGEGDDNIQSYSYRLCLTDDPANRRLLEKPPTGYDRARYAPILLPPAEKARLPLPFHHRFLNYTLEDMVAMDHIFHGHALPNRKRSWNATNFTGAGRRYPIAGADERAEIAHRHLEHALGLMYFLQHDTAVPPEIRRQACEWGLARDEFVATDNIPPQLYIREARRMVGRSVFTELDALLAPGLERAPIHTDSIAITEFSLDSLACTTERVGDSLCDGQLFQMEVSRPGQVPFGVLLPREYDNLLAVTTVSATHVGWGTIRQTPTLMHLAESAAWAIVLGARDGIAPAAVDIVQLQRTLVEHGVMITFFNDCDMCTPEPWLPAVQYWGARGLFPAYDARPLERIDAESAPRWATISGVDTGALAGRLRGNVCQACYDVAASERRPRPSACSP